MTFSAIAADPKLLHDMSEVNEMHGDGRWLSTNLGIETVAPSMVKKASRRKKQNHLLMKNGDGL